MRFFVIVADGVILGIGKGGSTGHEIGEDRYKEILAAIAQKPQATETTDYRLREDLTWEAYEIEPPDPDPDIDDDELAAKAEAYDILMGGAP